MKSLLFILCSTLLVIACNSAEKHRTTITTLINGWDSTTEKLNAFSETIANEVIHWQSMYDGMYAGEAIEKKLPARVRAQADSLKTTCRGHGATHRAIAEEVNAFLKNWQIQSDMIQQLKESLKNGHVSNELLNKISILFSNIATANAKLAAWQKQMQATKDECFETCSAYAALVQENKSE